MACKEKEKEKTERTKRKKQGKLNWSVDKREVDFFLRFHTFFLFTMTSQHPIQRLTLDSFCSSSFFFVFCFCFCSCCAHDAA